MQTYARGNILVYNEAIVQYNVASPHYAEVLLKYYHAKLQKICIRRSQHIHHLEVILVSTACFGYRLSSGFFFA